jgi:Protein of unknwon function (DUF3310).
MTVTDPRYYKNNDGKDLFDGWWERFGDEADIIVVAFTEKYLRRYQDKNGLEDLQKAQACLGRLINHVEARNARDNGFLE